MQDAQNMAPRLKRQNEEEELDSDGNEVQRFGSSSLQALLLPLHSLRMGLLTKFKEMFPKEMTREDSKSGRAAEGQHDR